MQSLVVNIAADRINAAKVLEVSWGAEVLLLVQNVMLGASNDTSVLDATNSLRDSMTCQIRIRRKAFPVALPFVSTICDANILLNLHHPWDCGLKDQ